VSARDRGLLIARSTRRRKGRGTRRSRPCSTAPRSAGGSLRHRGREDERDTEAAIVYLLETTERRTLENQINQSQRWTWSSQLAGGIAHDFNNVLSAIRCHDFLLTRTSRTDPSFQEHHAESSRTHHAPRRWCGTARFSRRQTLRPQVLVPRRRRCPI